MARQLGGRGQGLLRGKLGHRSEFDVGGSALKFRCSTNLDMLAPDSTATKGVRLWLLDDHWGGPRPSGNAAKIFAQLERTAEARHSTSKETFANSVRGV